MRHILALSTMLSAFWLVNSGHYKPLLLFFMVVSVLLVVGLCHALDVVDGESQPLNLTFTIPAYWLWLIWQVVISNIDVARRVWMGVDSISPQVIMVTADQKSDLGIVIYANSITLTPGTVSIDLEGNQISVHAAHRAIGRRSAYRRNESAIGTKTVLLIAVMDFLGGRPAFLDIAIVYALINFIAIIGVLRFFEYSTRKDVEED
jgi:multicomponent Na+:H+ antiporter subunit E